MSLRTNISGLHQLGKQAEGVAIIFWAQKIDGQISRL